MAIKWRAPPDFSSLLTDTALDECSFFNSRESTPIGSPLSQIIETGLNRPRFSADCLNVFLKELKTNIQQGWNKYPVMLMLDGVNVLFQERTLVSKTLPRRKASCPTTPFYIKVE